MCGWPKQKTINFVFTVQTLKLQRQCAKVISAPFVVKNVYSAFSTKAGFCLAVLSAIKTMVKNAMASAHNAAAR